MPKINPRANSHFQTSYAKNMALEEKKETFFCGSSFCVTWRTRSCLTFWQRFGILEVIPVDISRQRETEDCVQGGKCT